jgi:hypothetical protein
MMTLYLNREDDGAIDLYVTNGQVYRQATENGPIACRDGHKLLVDTFWENSNATQSAETRAALEVEKWVAAFMAAKMPVQYANDMVLPFEEAKVEEKVKNRK